MEQVVREEDDEEADGQQQQIEEAITNWMNGWMGRLGEWMDGLNEWIFRFKCCRAVCMHGREITLLLSHSITHFFLYPFDYSFFHQFNRLSIQQATLSF